MYSSRYPGKRFVKGILLRLRFCSCRLLQPQRSCSLRPEKSSLVPIIYHKNREIRPRKMIIWLLGCFFVESKGERVVDALKKKSVSFYTGFQIFLKHSILEIKSSFGVKDSRLLHLLFVSQRANRRAVRLFLLTLRASVPVFWD